MVLRRLSLDFITEVNVVSKSVQERLEIPMNSCTQRLLSLPRYGHNKIKPLGVIDITWRFLGRSKQYQSTFFVIVTDQFDALLGTASTRHHELFRVDPRITNRLV